MSRTAASAPINTQRGRARLAPQETPYWRGIRQGLRLGWRIAAGEPAGTWLVRVAWPKYSTTQRTIGTADDGLLRADGKKVFSYDQAVDRAIAIAAALMAGEDAGPTTRASTATVRDALDAYQKRKEASGQARQVSDTATLLRRHLPEDLAAKRLVELKRDDLVEWVRGLKAVRESAQLSQDRVDRIRTTMRASLRMAKAPAAALDGLRDQAVTEARGPRQEAAHRNIVLTREQRPLFLRAAAEVAGDDFALFAAVLDATGVRPGQAALCTAADLDTLPDGSGLLSIPRSAKGKPGVQKRGRIVAPLPAALAKRLSARVTELQLRTGDLLVGRDRMVQKTPTVWTKDGRTAWDKVAWGRAFNAVAARLALAETPLDAEASLYSLRHTRICAWIEAGLSTTEIGQRTDTSAKMIEQHYARELARRAHSQDRVRKLLEGDSDIYS